MGRRGEVLERLRHPTEALPHDLGTMVRTVVGVGLLIPALFLVSALVFLLAVLKVPRRFIDRCYTGFADLGILVGGTRLEIHGLEHVRPRTSYVVVANHESDWDPVVLFSALRTLSMRAVIKEEMMRVPVLGRALALTGNVRVTRTQSAADVERLRAIMQERPPDVSILFYAEGTRSRDGSLRTFKKGPFVAAIASGLPILPVATAGDRAAAARPGRRLRRRADRRAGARLRRPGRAARAVLRRGAPAPRRSAATPARSGRGARRHRLNGPLHARSAFPTPHTAFPAP
jgi:1-acyl-sn-glycerol-3-phosphate acyltransferase